jgi:hypothetical protein
LSRRDYNHLDNRRREITIVSMDVFSVQPGAKDARVGEGQPPGIVRSIEPWERNVAVSALVAALCALPLPPISNGPEIASSLAVGAVIVLAGLRWGLALLGVTAALLIVTFAPFVLYDGDAGDPLRVVGAIAMLAALPSLWSIRRAAPHWLELAGLRRGPSAFRTARRTLVAGALVILALPLF